MKKANIIKTLESVNGKWIRNCHFQGTNDEQTNTTSYFIAEDSYECGQNEYEMQPDFSMFTKEQLLHLLTLVVKLPKYFHQICGESTDTFGERAGVTDYWICDYIN